MADAPRSDEPFLTLGFLHDKFLELEGGLDAMRRAVRRLQADKPHHVEMALLGEVVRSVGSDIQNLQQRLEGSFSGVREEIREVRAEGGATAAAIREFRTENQAIGGELQELRGENQGIRNELREMRVELREHRESTDRKFEEILRRLDALPSGASV